MPELNNRWQQYIHDAPSRPKLKKRRTVPNWHFSVVIKSFSTCHFAVKTPLCGTLIPQNVTKEESGCRVQSFQRKMDHVLFFTEVNGKPVCLVCSQQVSVLKEYNIRRHYETHHGKKFNHLQGELRKEKINEML